MGYCITGVTYFFLFVGILTQAVSFLTSHMDENVVINQHKGIFLKCLIGKCDWFAFQKYSGEPSKL
jgi:hypothetical protein